MRSARRLVFRLFFVAVLTPAAAGQDASAPAILQFFEARWDTIENRMVDVFYAGYGGMWVPPPSRADSGGFSVGYDVFDRFDLGKPNDQTLYGTETSLKAMAGQARKAGVGVYTDLILNHNGFRDSSTPGFVDAGDYPGFVTTLPNDIDGDFHGRFESDDLTFRLAGLIDIAQEKNHRFIRQPVDPNDPNNIPSGSVYDRADPNNVRFYQDRDLGGRTVFDPRTNQNVTIYDFNTADPMQGDAVVENANDLLMRHVRWMVQEVGVDGFRIDAARHFPPWVLDLMDVAVHDAIQKPLLDGSTQRVFSFSEVFTGDMGALQAYTRKEDLGPDTVGGNRDALDMPLFFAMRDNLTDNGLQNDWRNVKNASFDVNDDGLANNGSQGVAHVASHDEFGPALSNVAHAFMLMRPGNANIYFNAKTFGDNRDFPKDGRGDALGGVFGDTLTTLIDIRNTHGRGNYLDRTPTGDEKEILIYEREGSALVVLSNRTDGGFDSRTVQTGFAPGTFLVELTGNAENPTIDPFDDFPSLVQVNSDGTVNLRILRNRAPGADGAQHNSGYLIYGLATPQGQLSLSNVSATLPGGTPTAQTNGDTRLGDVDVISADDFTVTLTTNAVNLLGQFRDRDADGDNALLKVDGGLDVNGNGFVDLVTPDSPIYGFEQFTTTRQDGFSAADGNGLYQQLIDATQLSEGYHFITARAFRRRDDGGPAVFSDFKRAIYVDRLKPVAEVAAFAPITEGVNENRAALLRSVDQTGDNMHVLLNLGAGLSDSEVLALIGDGTQASRIDRDLWTRDFFGLTNGNHVLTVVTFEVTGNVNVQRFAGFDVSTIFGAGLGDVDFNSLYTPNDIVVFENVLLSDNRVFNPAADLNADGLVNLADLGLLGDRLLAVGADGQTLAAYNGLVASIPEPATLALFAGIMVIMRGRPPRRD